MSLELLGSRVLAPYFGASIYVWGSLIGLILTALAGGYYLGGWLAELPQNQGESSKRFLDKLFLVVAVFLLFDLFSYVAILKWLSSWDAVWGTLAASLMLFCVPMVALAAVSPLVIKILSEQEKTGKAAGLVYAWGTAGSILGTFLTTFWSVPYFGSRLTLYGCFFISLLVLVGLFLMVDRKIILLPILFFLISLAVLSSSVLVQGVILETESAYNQIRLINRDGKILLTLNSQQDSLVHSGYSNISSGDNWSYLNNLFGVGPLIKPVDSLLVLGMAAGSTVLQHQAFSPQIKIDAVEIDPKIIAIAKEQFGLKENENLSIWQADARPFLSNNQKQYDMIEIDLFQGGPYSPFYTMTQEFFELTSKRLSQNGFIMMNVFAPGHQELLGPVLNAIASVYPSVYKIPLRSNFIILATRSATSLEAIKNELEGAIKLAPEDLKPAVVYVQDYIEPYEANKKAPIFTDDWAPVEKITYRMLKGLNL